MIQKQSGAYQPSASSALGIAAAVVLVVVLALFAARNTADVPDAVAGSALTETLPAVGGADSRITVITVTPVPTPQSELPTAAPNLEAATETPAESPVVAQSPEATEAACGPPPNWVRYTIVSGDTLFNLAQRTGTTMQEIIQANCLESSTIHVGRKLYLPRLPLLVPLPSPTEQPLPTATDTLVPPTLPPTATSTLAASATATSAATATSTTAATSTATATLIATATLQPTATLASTVTRTPTATAIPSLTPTQPPTATPSTTPTLPPPTATATEAPSPTATATLAPPTATFTPLPPTATATATEPPPTVTDTPQP